jgi:hypothetical protein
MLSQKEIDLLTGRIAKFNTTIANQIFYGISSIKTQKLIDKRDRYQTQLDAG